MYFFKQINKDYWCYYAIKKKNFFWNKTKVLLSHYTNQMKYNINNVIIIKV